MTALTDRGPLRNSRTFPSRAVHSSLNTFTSPCRLPTAGAAWSLVYRDNDQEISLVHVFRYHLVGSHRYGLIAAFRPQFQLRIIRIIQRLLYQAQRHDRRLQAVHLECHSRFRFIGSAGQLHAIAHERLSAASSPLDHSFRHIDLSVTNSFLRGKLIHSLHIPIRK